MRIRIGLSLLICCCAGVTACAGGSPRGPDAAVTTPTVGRPAPPSSVQAALSREAFTPYAALGQSNDDGLAPGESEFGIAQACLTAAGYPGAGAASVPVGISFGPASLAFAQPFGTWGYLGAAEAAQYGFRVPPGAALSALHISLPAADQADLPPAEQAAIGQCGTIVQDFTDAAQKGPLAGITTLSTDIGDDVTRDPAVRNATRGWAACMTRNGYRYSQPQGVFTQELRAMYGGEGPQVNLAEPVSSAANQAQVTAAITDAGCTRSADLAGTYFSVQASYEQQLVDANQQALAAAVRQYRAAYARELGRLPSLLKTAPAMPLPSAG